MNWICFILKHQWRMVYKNPYSQHPIAITRESFTKTEVICGVERPVLKLKVKCDRCEEEGWL